MHEWSLLIFTICLQAAIGGTIMLTLFYKKIVAANNGDAFAAMRVPLLTITGLAIIGLIASFTHLGTPTHAFHTIRNLHSSWMSREILVTGIFIGLVCVTVGLAFVQKKINLFLLVCTALIGIIDIYCMAAIYASSLVSGWDSIHTFTSFYGTAFVLGPVLVIGSLPSNLKEEIQPFIKYSFNVAIFGIVIQLIGVAAYSTVMPDVKMINGMNALKVLEDYQGIVALRWIIETIGIVILGILAWPIKKKISYSYVYLSLVAIVLAEGISRYVFYVLGS